jgi:outer membrane protein OmpA-like peptidoglycan-associated protein
MTIILVLAAFLTVYADVAEVGTTSNNFLKIMLPAKPAALGDAYAALADDINSIGYNPAGIGKSMTNELSLTHVSWFQNINYENASFLAPLSFGNLAFSVNWLHLTDNMNKTVTDPSSPSGYSTLYAFSPFSFNGSIAYAKEFSPDFYIGANLKLLDYAIDPTDTKGSAFSFMLDAGLIYDLSFIHGLSAGIAFKNIGPGTTFLSETYMQPMNMTGALGYGGDFLGAECDVQYYSDNNIDFSAGGYFTVFDLLTLRAGYKGGTVSGPTFGGGLSKNGLTLDYAYVPYSTDDLGATHRFTLTYAFGSPEVKIWAVPRVFSPNRDKYLDYTMFNTVIMSRSKTRSGVLSIYDSSRILVRTMRVDLNRRLYWNGANDFNQIVPDGTYYAELTVNYKNGIISKSELAPVDVDNTPPSVQVDANPKIIKPGQADTLMVPVNFIPSAYDLHGIGKWKLVITRQNGTEFKTFSGEGDPMQTIWDGSDDPGINFVNTGELYGYTFYAMDRVGNWGKSRTKFVKILLREIVITLSSDTLFDLGKADVKISVYNDLKKISDQIKSYTNVKVIVEGYTDNTPMKNGAYKDNMELSQIRAEAVAKFFEELFGMDPKIFEAIGKGDSNPIASNDTPEGRKMNRRVKLRISGSKWE